MNLQLILLLAVGAVVAYFLVQFLFKRDTAVEERRRRAIKLSQWCSKNGLPLAGQALDCYAVGDYSGLLFNLKHLGDVIGDDDQISPAVDKFLKTQLDKKLQSHDGREEVLRYVEERFRVQIPRELVQNVVAQLAVKPQVAEAPLTLQPAPVKTTQTIETVHQPAPNQV